MTRRSKIVIVKVAAVFSVVPVLLYGIGGGVSGGPPGPDAGQAGVPGEASCASCHVRPSDNSKLGDSSKLKVTFPGTLTYTPGVNQHLIVTITDANQKAWGFQATARQAGRNLAQAGSFLPGPDGYTQLVCSQAGVQVEQFGSCPSSLPFQYIEHTFSGVRVGTKGSATFEFDWSPPASNVGNVVMYVSGVAADGLDNSADLTHDNSYVQTYTLTQAQANAPSITSVVNGASFQSGVSSGSWVTVTGSNLANTSRSWSSSDIPGGVLPTSLDGVGVTINNKKAYVAYISPTQINLIAPSDESTGGVDVQVSNNGVTGNTAAGQLRAVSPAFFLWSGKYAVATRADYTVAAPSGVFTGRTTVPAKPGEVVILWATGFGPTSPAVPDGRLPTGQIASVLNVPSILIGNVAARVIAAALSPEFPGLYQIAIQVPSSLPDGDLPIAAQVAGAPSPAGVFLTIQH